MRQRGRRTTQEHFRWCSQARQHRAADAPGAAHRFALKMRRTFSQILRRPLKPSFCRFLHPVFRFHRQIDQLFRSQKRWKNRLHVMPHLVPARRSINRNEQATFTKSFVLSSPNFTFNTPTDTKEIRVTSKNNQDSENFKKFRRIRRYPFQ